MDTLDEEDAPKASADGGVASPPSDERGLDRLRRELRENGLPPTVLAALVAWAVTLAPAALARSSPKSALFFAIVALLAGVSGPLLVTTQPRLARHIGISLFLALAALTWLLTSPTLQPARLDPMRAAIGAIAWGVYALSWNERWKKPAKQPAIDPHAPALQARSTLSRLAVPIAAIGVAAGLVYLVVAWRVRETDRALLAHAVALACSVAVITGAATVATARGRRSSSGTRRVTSHALRPLILLVALAIGGAVLIILRQP
jgi:hypothetical protein